MLRGRKDHIKVPKDLHVAVYITYYLLMPVIGFVNLSDGQVFTLSYGSNLCVHNIINENKN